MIGREQIEGCLARTSRQSVRVRKLPVVVGVWLVIGIGLFAEGDLPTIWCHVVATLARLWQVAAGVKTAGK